MHAGGDQPRTGRYLAMSVSMEQVSGETWVAFERRLDRAGVAVPGLPQMGAILPRLLGPNPGGPRKLGRQTPIRDQMDRVRRLHAEDLAAGYAGGWKAKPKSALLRKVGQESDVDKPT
jgi:hypothetical protein